MEKRAPEKDQYTQDLPTLEDALAAHPSFLVAGGGINGIHAALVHFEVNKKESKIKCLPKP